MKKHLIKIALLLATGMMVYTADAQAPLSGYKYAQVFPPTYDGGKVDVHGFGQHLWQRLEEKTDLILLPYNAALPADVTYSQLMLVGMSHNDGSVSLGFSTVTYKPIYSITKEGIGPRLNWKQKIRNAIDLAVEELVSIRPSFDPSTAASVNAETFGMSTDDFYSYVEDTGVTVHDLEGVWQNDNGDYTVGVIRDTASRIERYKGFILETTSSRSDWKGGYIKFEIIPTAVQGRFNGTYVMGDFTVQQMKVQFSNGQISFSYRQNGATEDTVFNFIKVHPVGAPPDRASSGGSETEKEEGPSVTSTGTGFVVARNKIATNEHVIRGGSYYEIAFSDSLVFPLRLIQSDMANDIAVLSILPNANGLYPSLDGIAVSDPSTSRLGEDVFTIGFPLAGILSGEHTATDGSISAMSGLQDDPRFFQVSVPIQPGNSGGPLFNNGGQVIGVITSKLSDSYAFGVTQQLPQNVNFALKINYLLPLVGDANMAGDGGESGDLASRADLIEQLRTRVGQILVYK